jgi:hypothetical protein
VCGDQIFELLYSLGEGCAAVREVSLLLNTEVSNDVSHKDLVS